MSCLPCSSGCDRESCAGCCNRFCPCIAIYPTLCTAFLTLVAAAIFAAAFGAYCFISVRTSIFNFDWSRIWFIVVNSSLLALVVTAFLILISFSLWFVCSTSKRSVCYKSFILLCMLLSILALAAVMVASIFVIYGASTRNSAFTTQLKDVWVSVLSDANSTVACRIQSRLSCQGFERGDCLSGSNAANFSLCATVCRPEDVEGGQSNFTNVLFPGCRERMSSFFVRWNAVLVSGVAVAFILTLVSFFITCTSISFRSDK